MACLAPIFFALLILSTAASAQAQTPPPQLDESAKAIIGTWEFSNADRDKKCTATFSGERTAVGFKVEFDANCAGQFPLVADIIGWKFPDNDLLYLLDSTDAGCRRVVPAKCRGGGRPAGKAARRPRRQLAAQPRRGRAALRLLTHVDGARRRHGADGEAGLRAVDRAA
jgi:hypothetical protein